MSNLRQTRRSRPIALLRARETVLEPIRVMLVSSGVNEQKWRVRRILEEQGPMELSHLARDACLLLSSLTRMVRPLEDDALVTRSTPPDDRRKSALAITPSGVALIETHSGQSAAIFRSIRSLRWTCWRRWPEAVCVYPESEFDPKAGRILIF